MTVEKTLEQLPPAQVLNPRCLAFDLKGGKILWFDPPTTLTICSILILAGNDAFLKLR